MAKSIMKGSSLREQKNILSKNIKSELDNVLSNKKYKGSDGKVYDKNHYRKALTSDINELNKVNKKLSSKAIKKKSNPLKTKSSKKILKKSK